MKIVRYISICLLFTFIGSLLPTKAQDNPYKIDHSLYLLYEEATKHRNNATGLEIADTIYTKAIRINDKKAQCLALTIPVIYYFNNGKTELLEKAISRLQEISRKNNYLQYYYFGSIYKVNYLMNTGNTLRALQEAELTKEQAFADDYPYGISTCLRMMGNIYFARRENRTALDYYQQSLVYTQEKLPEQDISYIYWNISMLQQNLKQYEAAYENAEKGIKCAKTSTNKYACMLRKCTLLYALDREEEFKSYYQECLKATEKHGETRRNELNKLKIYNYILNQQYDKAHALADSTSILHERIAFQANIYAKEQKYKDAYQALQKLQSLQDSLNQLIQTADLSELNVRIGNEQLKRKAQALQLENTQLNLQKTTLELQQTKSQVEIEKMNAENNELLLKNRNLELAQFKAETERTQSLMVAKQAESERQLMILKFILIFFCFFAIALTLYLYLRRKSIRQLQEKNEELTIARDRAEQADKMKTHFMQNMSHEIRTPLNALSGFSSLLTEEGLDDETRRQCNEVIQQNSELLLKLINDVIDLSSLEFGKLQFCIAQHDAVSICRNVIDTVNKVKQTQAELTFTTELEEMPIETDDSRLQQVLINLLINATKFTPQGSIVLKLEKETDDTVLFTVTDTGCGIPKDKQANIFQRFEKLNENAQGSGLGLSICQLIIEHIGGQIWIDSEYAEGSRFCFTHPISQTGRKENKK